jgi:hypothetical protein
MFKKDKILVITIALFIAATMNLLTDQSIKFANFLRETTYLFCPKSTAAEHNFKNQTQNNLKFFVFINR